MSSTTPEDICRVCQLVGHGTCISSRCVCFAGFLGPTCRDPVTTTPAPSTVNTAAIVASILGSVLATLIICVIVFCIWKRRVKKKSFKLSTNTSNTTTTSTAEPVVAPALYNLSLSEQYSGSNRTESYHLYDELP